MKMSFVFFFFIFKLYIIVLVLKMSFIHRSSNSGCYIINIQLMLLDFIKYLWSQQEQILYIFFFFDSGTNLITKNILIIKNIIDTNILITK